MPKMKLFNRKSSADETSQDEVQTGEVDRLEGAQPFTKAILPVIACGAGLFSDGYINNVSSVAPCCRGPSRVLSPCGTTDQPSAHRSLAPSRRCSATNTAACTPRPTPKS